jgi:hypothetical protein
LCPTATRPGAEATPVDSSNLAQLLLVVEIDRRFSKRMHDNRQRSSGGPRCVRRRLGFICFAISCSGLLASCVPRERPDEKSAAPKPSAPPPTSERELAPAPTDPDPDPDPEPGVRVAPIEQRPASSAQTPASAGGTGPLDPLLVGVFSDDFERAGAAPELGTNWRATSAAWSLSNGRLCGENARNHPIWLARRLPVNAVIEFQASTESSDGDIKAEFWGDGRSAASGQSYTDATSYLTVFGGWKNRFHVLARIDEHAPDRREIKLVPGGADSISSTVLPRRVYRFHVERRDGRTVRWLVDDMEILTYPDTEPLAGPGHEHFGFNDWQVRLCFDNLRVTALQD